MSCSPNGTCRRSRYNDTSCQSQRNREPQAGHSFFIRIGLHCYPGSRQYGANMYLSLVRPRPQEFLVSIFDLKYCISRI